MVRSVREKSRSLRPHEQATKNHIRENRDGVPIDVMVRYRSGGFNYCGRVGQSYKKVRPVDWNRFQLVFILST